jgi:hypothetical protein
MREVGSKTLERCDREAHEKERILLQEYALNPIRKFSIYQHLCNKIRSFSWASLSHLSNVSYRTVKVAVRKGYYGRAVTNEAAKTTNKQDRRSSLCL